MKSLLMLIWVFALVLFIIASEHLRKVLLRQHALRTLEHAKFYLHATTCSYSGRGRQRDNDALALLTEKIIEVKYHG